MLAIPFGLANIPRLQAQDVTQNETSHGRKVISRIQPEYPTILKWSNIGGIVRLNASVLPNGTVINVTILGGNPILAECAMRAVKRWKYAPGPVQTNEVVTLDFSAH